MTILQDLAFRICFLRVFSMVRLVGVESEHVYLIQSKHFFFTRDWHAAFNLFFRAMKAAHRVRSGNLSTSIEPTSTRSRNLWRRTNVDRLLITSWGLPKGTLHSFAPKSNHSKKSSNFVGLDVVQYVGVSPYLYQFPASSLSLCVLREEFVRFDHPYSLEVVLPKQEAIQLHPSGEYVPVVPGTKPRPRRPASLGGHSTTK